MVEVTAEVKASAVVAVQEANIKLAKDVGNTGYQNLAGWRVALAKLKGELVNTIQDPEGQQPRANEDEKTP